MAILRIKEKGMALAQKKLRGKELPMIRLLYDISAFRTVQEHCRLGAMSHGQS